MAPHFTHPSVPSLHQKLDRETSHRLAVILFTEGNGYGIGVDMSSKLVFEAQRDWLAGPLGFWLMPSYSVAKAAAALASQWADDTKHAGGHLAGSTLRCYLPLTDEAAYEEHLAAAEDATQEIHSRFKGGSNEP